MFYIQHETIVKVLGVLSPPLSVGPSSASGVRVCVRLAGCYNVTAGCAGLAPGCLGTAIDAARRDSATDGSLALSLAPAHSRYLSQTYFSCWCWLQAGLLGWGSSTGPHTGGRAPVAGAGVTGETVVTGRDQLLCVRAPRSALGRAGLTS